MDDRAIPAWRDGVLQPLDKLTVHRLGLRHPAVSVFVRVGNAYLWQQRAAGKYHSGLLWANACCTHAAWGEDPALCARRRLTEELGIDLGPVRPLGQVEYRARVAPDMVEHEVVDVFLAEADSRPVLSPDPAEVAATEWLDLAALDQRIARHPDQFTPWLKLYLSDHRAELFGTNPNLMKTPASTAP